MVPQPQSPPRSCRRVGTSPEETAVNGSDATLYSAQVGWALLAGAFEGRAAEERVQVGLSLLINPLINPREHGSRAVSFPP